MLSEKRLTGLKVWMWNKKLGTHHFEGTPELSHPILTYIRTLSEGFIEFIMKSPKTEQINDGQDGLVVQDCQVMAVKLTGSLPIPLGKVACKFGNLWTSS